MLLTLTHLYSNFYFNDTATTEIYPLSLHDALPICFSIKVDILGVRARSYNDGISLPSSINACLNRGLGREIPDRKSTRLNSSHVSISYAVFCLKKKNMG